MRKKLIIFLATIWAGYPLFTDAQGISINENQDPPDASAMLDVSSTDKGMLIPSMTEDQRNAIVSPAIGLIVYQMDNAKGFYYYKAGGWVPVGTEVLAIDDLTDGISGTSNLFLGSGAGISAYSNLNNTALGINAMHANTIGWHNVAVGNSSLEANIDGKYNIAVGSNAMSINDTGSYNTVVGYEALSNSDTGNFNTGVGCYALYQSKTNLNTALGAYALYNAGSGNNTALGAYALYGAGSSDNTAVGLATLGNLWTGSRNTSVGNYALYETFIGNDNTSVGFKASTLNEEGNNNTIIGSYADENNLEGNNNTILGYAAGRGSGEHSKSGNVFIGYQAGFNEMNDNKLYIENSDDTEPLIYGDFSIDLLRINGTLDINNEYEFPTVDGGSGQLLQTDGSGHLTWQDNPGATALQWSDTLDNLATDLDVSLALHWPDTLDDLATDYDVSFKQNLADTSTFDATRYWVSQQGYYNIIEINDLTDGRTASESLYLGAGAGGTATSMFNVGIGDDALNDLSTGYSNTGIGYHALASTDVGYMNVAVGKRALNDLDTGCANVAIGAEAGYNCEQDSNVFIGYRAGYSETGSNKLYIENSESTFPLIYGEFDSRLVRFNGNVGIRCHDFGGGTHALGMRVGIQSPTSPIDGVLLWAQGASAELRVMDEAGNINTLSPHNFSMIEKSEPMAWSFYSENVMMGQKINVDMLRVVRLVEKVTGEKLAYIEDINATPYPDRQPETTSGIIQQQREEIGYLKEMVEELRHRIEVLESEK